MDPFALLIQCVGAILAVEVAVGRRRWSVLLAAVGGVIVGCHDQQLTQDNAPPTADLTWPTEGTEFPLGEPVVSTAEVSDDITPASNLEVMWISSREGVLEGVSEVEGDSVTMELTDLEEGEHTVTVEVMDGGGLSAEDWVTFVVTSDACPQVTILQPSVQGVYIQGEAVTVSVLVSDEDDELDSLLLSWSGTASDDDLPLTPDSEGSAEGELSGLQAGAYSLRVEVSDPHGESASDSVVFTVDEPAGPGEPTSSSLGDAAWQAYGTSEWDGTGMALDRADLTGDGHMDLVIASPSGTSSEQDEKEIYVFAGPLGTGTVSAETADMVVQAPFEDGLGQTIAAEQDLDGDGQPDLAAAYEHDDDYMVLIFAGPLRGFLYPHDATAVLTGAGDGDAFAYFGMDSCSDITGDGTADLVVGARREDIDGVSQAGAAYVWSGPLSGTLDSSTAAAKLVGEVSDNAALGYDVAGPGDLNGDGIGELLAAASNVTTSAELAGEVLLLEGPVSGNLALEDADARLQGSGYCDFLGRALDGAGDVDGDGYDDWLAGALYATRDHAEQGAAYLFTHDAAFASGAADDLATAVLLGEDSEQLAGCSVAGIGDLDGDGWSDIVVGALGEDSVGYRAGAVYVLTGPISGTIDLGDAPWKLVGENESDEAGTALVAGELDGDGVIDLVVSAPEASTFSNCAGSVYLMSGSALLE